MANFIKTLQSENKQKEQMLQAYELGLQELRVYLTSEKFWENTTVQVSDVLRRIEEIKAHVTYAECLSEQEAVPKI